MKVLNHPPYSPDLSPCDFFLFPRLKKMLSGNKYMSRSSLGSTIYQCLQQIPKEDYISAFRDWVKKVTKMCFSKGGILWRFVIKICLIKCSTEVIQTQWRNFLQDPRSWSRPILFVSTCSILSFWKQTANMPRSDWGDARTRLPFLKWGLYGKRFFFLCNIHILKFNITTTVKKHTGSRHMLQNILIFCVYRRMNA